ncbi:DUF3427 domain-containing protein, partial [Shewanella sp. 0m-11]
GLRLTKDKECCTVIDFVGNSRPEYDFSHKFRALIGKTNQSISKEIKQGFPHLPLGCRIELQEKTQQMILKNISLATLNKNRLLSLISNYANATDLPLTLANFLHIYPDLSLEDIYKVKVGKFGGWRALVETSSGEEIQQNELDIYAAYYRAINNRLLSCTSISYLLFIKALCESDFSLPTQAGVEPKDEQHNQLFSTMCHYDFWDKTGKQAGFDTIEHSLFALKHKKL